MHSLVKDLMTIPVVTVRLEIAFKELVVRLAEHRVSVLPVIDNQERVLGVVSEAALLLKEEHPGPYGDVPLGWTRRRRAEQTRRPRQWSAPHDRGRGLDPAPTTVADAARRMHAAGVKRLPVVDVGDRLVGIMSRADLLKVPNWPASSAERLSRTSSAAST
jgi:CBS-domain-containing membrane protein